MNMEIVAAKCPACGADLQLDSTLKMGRCQYCDSEFLIEGNTQAAQPAVGAAGGGVVNQEFEAKLAVADNMAQRYFSGGAEGISNNRAGFNKVFQYYSDAELAGGNVSSKYWLHLTSFCAKAGLDGFKYRQKFIDLCNLFMDNAIKYAAVSDKPSLENQRQLLLNEISRELYR
jgi:DNA-directed RNA polymerase subunit RPC12/RpoP